MIPRPRAMLSLVLFVAAASGLYVVKYRVQAIQVEITALNKQLEQERESMRVVEAEWAYLSRPERIQRLSAEYLKLQPVQPSQMAGVVAHKGDITPAAAHVLPQASPAEGE